MHRRQPRPLLPQPRRRPADRARPTARPRSSTATTTPTSCCASREVGSREAGDRRQESGVRSQRTGRRAGSVSDRRPSASGSFPTARCPTWKPISPDREEDRRPRSHDANARCVQGRDPPPRYDEGTRIDQGRPRAPLPALGRGGGIEWLAATGECVHVHFS